MKEIGQLIPRFIIIIALVFACSKSDEFKWENKIPDNYRVDVIDAINIAADNKSELLQAIRSCPQNQAEGLAFLLANMPERDLKNLSFKFLLENVNFAYQALAKVKWGKQIPGNIFLNYILPYVNLHERRDNWRADFYTRFMPLVENSRTSGEAAVKLNEKIWDILNVHYSTKRPKADQSPYESIEAGMASCTGLSILLVDACRAVGVPARFVGVPLWVDKSGNHSWVEIWDKGWHIVGAGEPGPLDQTWFLQKASLANDSDWRYRIYAASFKKTQVIFPPLFDSTATYVHADIITQRYSKQVKDEDRISLAIRLFDTPNGKRVLGQVKILKNGKVIGKGETRDAKHDYNDFLFFMLDPLQKYRVVIQANKVRKELDYKTDSEKYQFLNVVLNE